MGILSIRYVQLRSSSVDDQWIDAIKQDMKERVIREISKIPAEDMVCVGDPYRGESPQALVIDIRVRTDKNNKDDK